MYTPGSKLNRSCSESDLHTLNSDNSSVQDLCNGFEKSGCFVTKRVLYLEEVFHSGSPDVFRQGTSYQTLGRSTPDHLHKEVLFTSNMLNTPFYNNSIHLIRNDHRVTNPRRDDSNFYANRDGVVPMEIDAMHDTSLQDLKSENYRVFSEAMDMEVDPENVSNSRYSNLENILKKRNFSKPPQSTSFSNQYLSDEIAGDNKIKIKPITQMNNKNDSQYSVCILLLVFTFLLTLVYVVFFPEFLLYVNSDVQYDNIQKDLLENVYGQNSSINAIVRSLRERERWSDKIKVLSFIGSTGVGKTFVANIIKSHFLQELVHELFGMQLNYERQRSRIITNLKSCCLNLIVIDDLKRKDTVDLLAFLYSLPKDQFVLVVSIFNIQYTNDKIIHTINYTDIVEIRNEFDHSGLNHELIIFEEFNNGQVKDWIQNYLKSQSVDLNLQEQVLNNVFKEHEVKYNGLKGLNAKLSLELKKHSP